MNNELRTKNYWQLATGDRQLYSTNVECSLQNHLFLQNEPNFRKSQMNVSKVLTRNYDKMDTWSIRKNEPKTNPNEPNSNPIQTQFKPNTNPIQTQYKPNQSQFQDRILFDDYSFILYTGVLYKKSYPWKNTA